MNNKKQVKALIGIILDLTAEDHEKDDAGMDLADYDDDRALESLIKVSQYPSENDLSALDVYGETIGEYWIRRDLFPLEKYMKLRSNAQNGIYNKIRNLKPEWIKKYKLDEIELNKD